MHTDKSSFNVKFFDWDYLHLTALTKETYFINLLNKLNLQVKRSLKKKILPFSSITNSSDFLVLFDCTEHWLIFPSDPPMLLLTAMHNVSYDEF